MNDKLKPALVGGLVAGLLSVIPLVSACSCLWAIAGGALAGYLYIQNSGAPVQAGGGAMIGVLAGTVAAVVRILIGIPVSLAFARNAGIEQQLRHAGVTLPFSGAMLIAFGGIIGALVIIGLSTVGGLLAVPLFEKRKGAAPPPPPGLGA